MNRKSSTAEPAESSPDKGYFHLYKCYRLSLFLYFMLFRQIPLMMADSVLYGILHCLFLGSKNGNSKVPRSCRFWYHHGPMIYMSLLQERSKLGLGISVQIDQDGLPSLLITFVCCHNSCDFKIMVQRYEQMRRLQWYKRGAAYYKS